MTDEITWIAISVNVLIFAAGWGAMYAQVQQTRADIGELKRELRNGMSARLRALENRCSRHHGDDHR